jgi:hypothetical protein
VTEAWARLFQGRPAWLSVIMLFCAYMTFVYLPWDFFWKPVAVDQEAWFGVVLTGWAAKATEPLHWAIYAAGTYGLYRMRAWMWPWASLYVLQIAIGMFVWQLLDDRGRGWPMGVVAALPFLVLSVMLWRARPLFARPTGAAEA